MARPPCLLLVVVVSVVTVVVVVLAAVTVVVVTVVGITMVVVTVVVLVASEGVVVGLQGSAVVVITGVVVAVVSTTGVVVATGVVVTVDVTTRAVVGSPDELFPFGEELAPAIANPTPHGPGVVVTVVTTAGVVVTPGVVVIEVHGCSCGVVVSGAGVVVAVVVTSVVHGFAPLDTVAVCEELAPAIARPFPGAGVVVEVEHGPGVVVSTGVVVGVVVGSHGPRVVAGPPQAAAWLRRATATARTICLPSILPKL